MLTLLPANLARENLTAYVQAILDPSLNPDLPKLKCPPFNRSRYEYLQTAPSSSSSDPPLRYFFALNLRNCLPVLPRLLASILEAILFLGPSHCALSIVEGNSPDGTADVLAALEPFLTTLNIRTHFSLNTTPNPLAPGADRFSTLAQLRNLALLPLTTNPTAYHPDTTVAFINDVALCPDDILELLHQKHHQRADMACALDWTGGGGPNPVFYDVYVARAANGDLFFDVPPDTVSWSRAGDLFWNEPVAKQRYEKREPFQVFACWNGAVVFTARPVVEGKVGFRGARRERGECHAGEPGLFCKDLWWEGYGRIMVVPTVGLEYAEEAGAALKGLKGFTAALVAEETGRETPIEWAPPPDLVKCMPTFNDQSWRPWNETLV
jgi:alpha-1,3-mannosyltransferase